MADTIGLAFLFVRRYSIWGLAWPPGGRPGDDTPVWGRNAPIRGDDGRG